MEQRLSYFRYGAVSVDPLRFDIGYLYEFTDGSQFPVCLESLFLRFNIAVR